MEQNNTFETWYKIGTLIGAFLVPITLAVISYLIKKRKCNFEERKKRFKEMDEKLIEKSIRYEGIARDWYKYALKGKIEGDYLLYKSNWVHQQGAKLIRLEDVKINYHTCFGRDKKFKKLQNSLSKDIFPKPKELFTENAEKYLHKNYFPKPTFSLKNFEMDCKKGEAILNIYLGCYFDFLNTCMPFQYETAFEDLYFDKKPSDKSPLRNKFSLLDTDNRFVSIGISTLVVIKNIKDEERNIILNGRQLTKNMFLLHRRSSKVSTSANQIHVVPSGSYQPATINNKSNPEEIKKALENVENLMSTVEREFAEEILGVEIATQLSDYKSLEKYKLKPMLKETYLIGLGFYPLDTHVDIFSISIIDANTSGLGNTVNEIEYNIENKIKIKGNDEGDIQLHEFSKENLVEFMNNTNATPSLKSIFEIIVKDFENITNQLKC